MPAKKKPAPASVYELPRKPGLYIKPVKGKGHGVFCTHALHTGTEIETTPALILDEKQTKIIEKTLLGDYVFKMGKISKKLQRRAGIKNIERASCAIFGLMTFCNHDENPNAEILWEERDGVIYHVLNITRPIPKDTEICTSYGEGWFAERKMKVN